jgi:hypothetical protein
MDNDQGQVDSAMYWWDLLQSSESLDLSDVPIALCAGTYNIAAGVAYNIRFYKYPRGTVHGIAVDSGHTQRYRSQTDQVELYESADGGATYSLIETCDTDEHGRFRATPLKELDGPYRVGTTGGALSVVNRSYTFDGALRAIMYEPYMDVDECGLIWLVTEGGGALRVYYLDARDHPPRIQVTRPTTATGYDRPSIAVRGGELLVAATDVAAGNTVIWRSYNRGETWAAVATDLGTGLTLGTIGVRPSTGEVMLCGLDTSYDIKLRSASDANLTRDDLTAGVDELTVVASAADMRSQVVHHPDGSILVAVQAAGDTTIHRCRSLATGFAVV